MMACIGSWQRFLTKIWLLCAIISAIGVIHPASTASPTQHSDNGNHCPDVKLPDDSNGTCVLSADCSKVTCTSPEDKGPFGHMVLTVQAYGCHQPLKATVTLESSLMPKKWSHTFEDGDKAALPTAPGVPVEIKQFLKVELKKNGDKVNFKLLLLFESGAISYNTTLLKGELRASKCVSHPTTVPQTEHSDKGNHPQENCPVVKLPDGSKGTCVLSEDCSKVTCTSRHKKPFAHMVLTVQAYGCRQPLKATVTMESAITPAMTPEKWSHTFEDGDKAAMPMAPGASGGPAQMKVFLKAELKKNGDKVHFKLVLLFESKAISYNTTALQGELQASKCDSKQCPVVNFLPSDPNPHKCSFSDHCSKVECVAAGEGHKLTITFKLNPCQQPLTGTVTMLLQSPGHINWSHTLKDGEKAKIPATPSSFTGDLPVADASMFIQVKLRKTQGYNVNFTVAMVGQVTETEDAKPYPVNVVLLQGELSASTGDCGSPSASWFSRQSGGVKALVIIIPVTMVILLGLVVGLCCYRSRRDGLRFPVNIFQNRNKLGMERLSNDL